MLKVRHRNKENWGEIHSTIYDTAKICEMVMMNCLCEMVDLGTAENRTSRRDHRQEASLSRLFQKPKSNTG